MIIFYLAIFGREIGGTFFRYIQNWLVTLHCKREKKKQRRTWAKKTKFAIFLNFDKYIDNICELRVKC